MSNDKVSILHVTLWFDIWNTDGSSTYGATQCAVKHFILKFLRHNLNLPWHLTSTNYDVSICIYKISPGEHLKSEQHDEISNSEKNLQGKLRTHPLFFAITMGLLQEIINSRYLIDYRLRFLCLFVVYILLQ